jgi:putative Ca2+/H+ antiporter (TMEM165/GDT1 family)
VEIISSSFLVVLLAEMGDKTQLLAFSLAARFRKPWAVLAGILCATLVNHGFSAWLGLLAASWLTPKLLNGALALSFLGFGVWTLIPDKDDGAVKEGGYGAFLTSLALFFLVEIGDKTQLATLALGARFHDIVWVTAGTTAGMMVADGLAVFLGETAARRIPYRALRVAASCLFFVFGVLAAWSWYKA